MTRHVSGCSKETPSRDGLVRHHDVCVAIVDSPMGSLQAVLKVIAKSRDMVVAHTGACCGMAGARLLSIRPFDFEV